ncbi:MAG: ubiquinol-cytochrome c reductase iron-sulfur subunit [Bacteroidetes bacterium]|nr:ubiquinol-cytochrome c reductase iron-sulfur subunit [Bacteroidota bacterium]
MLLMSGFLFSGFKRFGGESDSGTALEIVLSDYPELSMDGGYKVIKDVMIDGIEDNLIIVRQSEKNYVVLSSICRHKKCNVKFRNSKQLFVCPCHGSNYDLEGSVVKGPSSGPLPKYKVEVNETILKITR